MNILKQLVSNRIARLSNQADDYVFRATKANEEMDRLKNGSYDKLELLLDALVVVMDEYGVAMEEIGKKSATKTGEDSATKQIIDLQIHRVKRDRIFREIQNLIKNTAEAVNNNVSDKKE